MNLKDKSVVVTGGAGFIGSHLVDRIIEERPSKILVIDNFSLGKESNLDNARRQFGDLQVYDQNIEDMEKMRHIFKENQVDVVFNLAIIPLLASLEKPKQTFEHNVKMTSVICELGREQLYDTLIQCSSSEAYGTALYYPMNEEHPLKPTTPYAASKAAADMLALSYYLSFDLDVTIIRPFNNYGPRQNEGTFAGVIPKTVKRILAGKPPLVYGDGKQTRDYLYVTDTAEAFVKAYNCQKARGEIINIASGKEWPIGELVSSIGEYMRSTKKVVYAPPRQGDVRRHLADISKAKDLIGFEPQVDPEDGLHKTVDWYISHMKEA